MVKDMNETGSMTSDAHPYTPRITEMTLQAWTSPITLYSTGRKNNWNFIFIPYMHVHIKLVGHMNTSCFASLSNKKSNWNKVDLQMEHDFSIRRSNVIGWSAIWKLLFPFFRGCSQSTGWLSSVQTRMSLRAPCECSACELRSDTTQTTITKNRKHFFRLSQVRWTPASHVTEACQY